MANISLITQINPFLFISEFLLATAPIIFPAIKPSSRFSSLNIISAIPDTINMSGKKTVAYFVNWVGFSDTSLLLASADFRSNWPWFCNRRVSMAVRTILSSSPPTNLPTSCVGTHRFIGLVRVLMCDCQIPSPMSALRAVKCKNHSILGCYIKSLLLG